MVGALVVSGLWLLGPDVFPGARTAQVAPALNEPAGLAAAEAPAPSYERRLRRLKVEASVARVELARRQAAQRARERRIKREKRRLAALLSTPFTFTIGSFNVLGSQHSSPGGQKASYPDAPVRTARAVRLARAHGVDILGAQELQEDQLNGLTAGTGMKAWPGYAWGSKETDNSILYDPEVFELVRGDVFHITFMGRTRPQPIVRLRHLATTRELYVVNVHPSAGDGKYATERQRGYATIAGVVSRLHAEGLPVLLTGDMNDREAFYCGVVATTALTASNGGGSGCAPPPGPIPVDWVVGAGVSGSKYWRDTTPVENRTSDHFFISATATVE